MNSYELVVLLHPDLEIDVDAPVAKIEKQIESAGGKIIKRDNWGKKRLAYRIKRLDFAVYIYFELQVDPQKVRAIDRALLLNEEVIRHILVTKIEPAKPIAKKQKAKVESQETKAAAVEEGK